MTYEPMHSAQAQSVRITKKIYFGFVSHYILSLIPSQVLMF